jgi:hypothetical protein
VHRPWTDQSTLDVSNGFLAGNLEMPAEAVKASCTLRSDLFVTLGIPAGSWQDEHSLVTEKRIARVRD